MDKKRTIICLLVTVSSIMIFCMNLTEVAHHVEAQAAQPERSSSLCTNDGKAILNGSFWKLIFDNIGHKRYKSMIFMFGQCYGGGFVNGLPTQSLPNTVAMSASKYDEPSWADPDTPAKSKQEYDEWLQKVRDEVDGNPAATMDQIFSAAKNADRRAQNGQETPQISPAAGNNMKIHEGKSNYVIMWGGYSNCHRYWNDLERFYGTLRARFGYTHNEIIVLYGNGDGKRPDGSQSTAPVDSAATFENLKTTIENLPMNENETLLFWSSDHGNNDQNILPGTELVDAQGAHEFSFDLPLDFIEAMPLAETQSSIEITHQDVIDYNSTIYINTVEVGPLNPTNSTHLFFARSSVSLSQFNNTFTVISGQDLDFTVSNITLDSGAVPTQKELAVGGISIPVDKPVLLAPFIALAATVVCATISVTYVRKRWFREPAQTTLVFKKAATKRSS